MTFEAWLVKVKTKLSKCFNSVHHYTAVPNQKTTSPAENSGKVGFLAFEIAGTMSKLLQIWSSLSDSTVSTSTRLEGVRRIVSNDEALLLRIAGAEIADILRIAAASVSNTSYRCDDESLRSFDRIFRDFADSGRDPRRWILTSREMEAGNRKMERYAAATETLFKEIEELLVMETSLRKVSSHADDSIKEEKIANLQYRISRQRRKVKHLKEKSLWNRSYDEVNLMLARSIFTVLARIKLVFGLGPLMASLPRSFSSVHPMNQTANSNSKKRFFSGPLTAQTNFFESNWRLLKPAETTLGAAGLAVHYAKLIILTEKMIKSPMEARDDLYEMLPSSLRWALRERLEGTELARYDDPSVAGEYRHALSVVLAWLLPMARDTMRWETESHGSVVQTLVFADRERAEAAIIELLVGLNYTWRFEREKDQSLRTSHSSASRPRSSSPCAMVS